MDRYAHTRTFVSSREERVRDSAYDSLGPRPDRRTVRRVRNFQLIGSIVKPAAILSPLRRPAHLRGSWPEKQRRRNITTHISVNALEISLARRQDSVSVRLFSPSFVLEHDL